MEAVHYDMLPYGLRQAVRLRRTGKHQGRKHVGLLEEVVFAVRKSLCRSIASVPAVGIY